MEDIACTECMWVGGRDDTDFADGEYVCPECESDVEWIDKDTEYQKPFNWNKI